LKITEEQLDIAQAMSRIVMAWLAFLCVFVTTGSFLGLLVYCVLKHEDVAAKVIVGVINGFLLSLLRIIFKHVFPDGTPKKQGAKKKKTALAS
jgi:hypothetical protein